VISGQQYAISATLALCLLRSADAQSDDWNSTSNDYPPSFTTTSYGSSLAQALVRMSCELSGGIGACTPQSFEDYDRDYAWHFGLVKDIYMPKPSSSLESEDAMKTAD